MGDAHRHLMTTDGEWLAFMDDVQQRGCRMGHPLARHSISWSVRCSAPFLISCSEMFETLVLSGSTRLVAFEANVTKRPSAEIEEELLYDSFAPVRGSPLLNKVICPVPVSCRKMSDLTFRSLATRLDAS
jgi:hypothetical protein